MPAIRTLGAGGYIRLMIHSYPGWGKTVIAASAAEAGLKTLIIRSPMDQIPKRALAMGAEEYVVTSWEDMSGGDGILEHLRMAPHGYEWVWLDCLSIIQDVLLDDVWQAVVAEKPHRGALTPAGGLDRGEFGRNMERIQQWIRHIVGANTFHFGITCHPAEQQHPTNDEGGTILAPYIQGKNMTEKICGYCNIVAFLEVMSDEDEDAPQSRRRLHVRENSRFYAKDLFDAFPLGYIDDPTVAKLMAGVYGTNTKPALAAPRKGRRGGRRRAA